MGEDNILTGYDLFVDQTNAVILKYLKLKVEDRQGKIIVAGEVDVVDKFGHFWESYCIEIHCTELFPKRFPNLFETSNKIPKIADWHIYEDTLSCCVKILPEEILTCLEGITLLEYVDNEAIPYLFNQTHRKVEGFYVNGEHDHGIHGFYDYYKSILKTSELNKLIQQLLYIANNDKPGRTSICFCGSNEKYRYCHREAFNKLKPLGKEFLENQAYQFHQAVN